MYLTIQKTSQTTPFYSTASPYKALSASSCFIKTIAAMNLQTQPESKKVKQCVNWRREDEGTEATRSAMAEESGRERLRRHRIEVAAAGRVWIPEAWGKEDLLKEWIDSSIFESCLAPNGIMSARAALIEQGRRANSNPLNFRIQNRC